MKLPNVALAIAGLMWLSLAPAHADSVYDWTISGTGISGSGTIDLGALNGSSYPIDGITGSINGDSITQITGYYGAGLGGDVIYTPSSGLYGGWSYVDGFGVSLEFSDGVQINIADAPGSSSSNQLYSVDASSSGFLYGDTFSINGSAVSETPLPATWTLMLLGVVGLGFAAYWRQKRNTSLAAA